MIWFSPQDLGSQGTNLERIPWRIGMELVNDTNVRCIESTKAGKTKIAWKTPRMGGFFSGDGFLWTDVKSMLICVEITWKEHRFCSTLTQIPEAQVSVPRQEPGNSANLVTETHHDFPTKKMMTFWCHLCSLHGLSISKATGWCAFRRLLSLRRRF